eukprot:4298936-Amphidinium_carterae.1
MKEQNLQHLEQKGYNEIDIVRQEGLYEKMKYTTTGALHRTYREGITTVNDKYTTSTFDNGRDERHFHYNFHRRIEYAINDFINVYLHNIPIEYPQRTDQLHN